MKYIKLFILSLILCLTLSTNLKAEYFSDVIVTSPNGIWTDSRTYSTLNDAVAAVGNTNQRTLKIVSPQVVTSLTIPSNITLEFERDGSIVNSGQLTINTKNIIAPNRRIFAGVGNIDFASGSTVKSGWFNNVETAFALTTNDTVTLLITKPQTVTSSYSPGTNVHLKWEEPGNILTVNAGVTVSNLRNIEAGDYQIFAGAGDLNFLDSTDLKLIWFSHLRSLLTFVGSTTKINLLINRSTNIDYTDTIISNISTSITNGALLTSSPGIVLTINGPFSCSGQCFSGMAAGDVVFGPGITVLPQWFATGTGTSADPWTGWATAITWAAAQKYVFSEGYYSYATAPSWALADIDIEGQGKVYLVHTGSGAGIDLHNTSGSHYKGARLHNLNLKGNANTTIGLDLYDMHNCDISDIHIGPMSPTGTGFKIAFSVYSNFRNLNISTGFVPGTTTAELPAIGLHVTRTSGSDRTTDCTFDNVAVGFATTTGILIDYANNNRFIGMTMEYCGKGLSITGGAAAALNSFYSLYFENNTTHDIHIADGQNNSFYSPFLNAGIAATAGNLVIDAGQGNKIDGGLTSTIVIASGVNNTLLSGVRVSTITDAGTDTKIIGCYNPSTFAQHPLKLERQPRVMTITIANGSDADHIKCSSSSVYRGDTNTEQDNIGKDSIITGVWQLTVGGDNLLLLDAGIAGDLVAVLSTSVVTNLSATAINVKGVLNSHRLYMTFTDAATGAAVDLTTLVDTGTITLQIAYITDL